MSSTMATNSPLDKGKAKKRVFMDHPVFCTVVKLFHSIANKPKSADEILPQVGAELNDIIDLLNDMKTKINIDSNGELQVLYNHYRKYYQRYLELVEQHGMVIPSLEPGEDISQTPLPVRDPTRKRDAFRKSSREDSKNLFSNVKQLSVSTQRTSNQIKQMTFEAHISPPLLPSYISSESSSSSSSGGSAYPLSSKQPGQARQNSPEQDPYCNPQSQV